jgi:hypothetical protein
LFQRFLALVAEDAGFGFLVHLHPDFGPVRGVNDGPVLAQYPDLFNVLLVSDVLDYLVYIIGLILKHGETGALGDHLGQLGDATGRPLEKSLPVMPDDKHGKHEHRRRQGDPQRQADLELEGHRAHSPLHLSSDLRGDRSLRSRCGKP